MEENKSLAPDAQSGKMSSNQESVTIVLKREPKGEPSTPVVDLRRSPPSVKRRLDEDINGSILKDDDRRKKISRSTTLSNSLLQDVMIGQEHEAPTEFDADSSRNRVLDNLVAQAPQEEQEQAKRDKSEFIDAARYIGHASAKPVDGGMWKMPGMKTPAHSHQVIGAGRGLKSEKSGHGVLLTDQMGLGKTIEALIAIAASRSPTEAEVRSTLVIVTPNNFEQWKKEVWKHCEEPSGESPGIRDMMLWHGRNAASEHRDPHKGLIQADLVLTTTTEVIDSFNEKEKDENDDVIENGKNAQGLLHKARYKRIILDEAHMIRNDKSVISQACRELTAENHWAMTGTPLLNATNDLYSILAFLKHPLATDRKEFQRKSRDLVKLLKGFDNFTIRRTYQSKLFGKKLVSLPKMQRIELPVKLKSLEAKIYKIVHAESIPKNKKSSAAIFGEKEEAEVTGLAIRPRQWASHPCMIDKDFCKFLGQDGLAKLRALLNPDDYSNKNDKILAQLLGAEINAISKTEPAEPTIYHLKSRSDPGPTPNCVHCKKQADDPQITSCAHIYCRTCLRHQKTQCEDLQLDLPICDACGLTFDFEVDYLAESHKGNTSKHAKTKAKEPIRTANTGRKSGKDSLAKWRSEDGKIYRSAKVIELVKAMKQYLRGNTKKIILFTQWLAFADVLAEVCKEEKWEHVTYVGSMSTLAKDQAVKDFGDPKKKKRVLVASMQAGGVGLNLTMASKVILIDHWWNNAIEQQAFARVYRIGQKRETEIVVMVVMKTVEERMMRIKNEKEGQTKGFMSAMEVMKEIWQPFEDSDIDDDDDDDDNDHKTKFLLDNICEKEEN